MSKPSRVGVLQVRSACRSIDATVDPSEPLHSILVTLLDPEFRERLNAHPNGEVSFGFGTAPSRAITFKKTERFTN